MVAPSDQQPGSATQATLKPSSDLRIVTAYCMLLKITKVGGYRSAGVTFSEHLAPVATSVPVISA